MAASFRRAPEFERRNDMIEATLDCIAERGIQATTVRAVAAHAGVSNGLIRHHFASKDNLIVAAYRRTIEMMTQPAFDALGAEDVPPAQRLSNFVAASLGGPVADPRMLSLWATFISRIHVDAEIAEVHDEGYLNFRRATEWLIAEVLRAEGRKVAELECERLAIAINALMDGLWLEGCLAGENNDEQAQIEIGRAAVESLLGVKLPATKTEN